MSFSSTPIIYCKHQASRLLAFGDANNLVFDANRDIQELNNFLEENKGKFIFGFLSYDLKNDFENLHSENQDFVSFCKHYFFVPDYVVRLDNQSTEFLQGTQNEKALKFIEEFINPNKTDLHTGGITLKPRINADDYQLKIKELHNHLQRGDIYEITFCQEFFAENAAISPIKLFWELDAKTNAPFASFVHWENRFLLSASPERFIQKTGTKIISQPIKGTAKRGASAKEDLAIKKELLDSEKERSENIMIVDLVRNDLSRIAKNGSVSVPELCGIHTFETVHQLISTVEAELEDQTTFNEILKALFPMGSMTGAPKIRAMELIEEYEDFKRGLFSGSVGFFHPNGDFDFNVVIRSILYNQLNRYISCPVGGAITIQSTWEQEYQECLLKVRAMQELLENNK